MSFRAVFLFAHIFVKWDTNHKLSELDVNVKGRTLFIFFSRHVLQYKISKSAVQRHAKKNS